MPRIPTVIINILTLISFMVGVVLILRFLEIDACLDAGGTFNSSMGLCEGAHYGFQSLLWRNWTPLWLIVAIVASVPAWLIRVALSKLLVKTAQP